MELRILINFTQVHKNLLVACWFVASKFVSRVKTQVEQQDVRQDCAWNSIYLQTPNIILAIRSKYTPSLTVYFKLFIIGLLSIGMWC